MSASTPTPKTTLYWLSFLAGVLVLAWLPWLTETSHELINATMLDAFSIFATAKLINGAISVIQSISVSVSVFAGLAIQPGEFLDPLNDLIESFSWISLLALASLGMQKLLLVITAGKYFNVLVSIAAVALAITLLPRYSHHHSFSKRLVILALTLRFAVPATILLSETTDWLLLSELRSNSHQELIESQSVLTTMSDAYNVNTSSPAVPASPVTPAVIEAEPRPLFSEDPIGYWQWEEPRASTATNERDWQQIARDLEQFLSNEDALNSSMQATTVSVVDLTVIFLLQTLGIPLLFLFVVWRVVRKFWTV